MTPTLGPTTPGEDRFRDLAGPLLADPEVTASTMMGFPCLRVRGQFFASTDRTTDNLIVKLPRGASAGLSPRPTVRAGHRPADARVAFTLDLGLVSAPSVSALANGDATFYFTLSPERLGELTSDILVSYADSQADSDTFLASPRARLLEQVQRGTVAEVVGTELIAAVSPPTALSLTWGLEEYVDVLSRAAGEPGAGGG